VVLPPQTVAGKPKKKLLDQVRTERAYCDCSRSKRQRARYSRHGIVLNGDAWVSSRNQQSDTKQSEKGSRRTSTRAISKNGEALLVKQRAAMLKRGGSFASRCCLGGQTVNAYVLVELAQRISCLGGSRY
jgi:hypothetical protein